MTHDQWLGLWIALFVVWCIPIVWVIRTECTEHCIRIAADTRYKVFQELNAAREGRQFEPYGYLHGGTPEEVAYDMALYAETVAGYSEADLLPHVRDWMTMWGLS